MTSKRVILRLVLSIQAKHKTSPLGVITKRMQHRRKPVQRYQCRRKLSLLASFQNAPDEKVNIKTVELFYDYIKAVLKEVPVK